MTMYISRRDTVEGKQIIAEAKANGTYHLLPADLKPNWIESFFEDLFFSANEGHKMNYTQTPVMSNEGVVHLETKHGVEGAGATPMVTTKQVKERIQELRYGDKLDGEGEVLRYPASPAIRSDSDYVLLTFFKYLPPGKQGVRTGDVAYTSKEELGRVEKDKNHPDYQRPVTEITQYTNAYLNVYNNMAHGEGAANYERTDEKQIMLYMPEDLGTKYTANWNGKAISTAGMDMLSAAGSSGIGNKILAGGATITGMGQRVGATWSADTVRSAVSSITGDTLTNDEIFGAIGGVVTNPNTELLFNNMSMRTFDLKWKLMPRNATEAGHIKEIVRTLKRSMLPGASVKKVFDVSWGDGVEAGFISVPDLVRVSFMHGPSQADYLPQYKMCAITEVDINYTPDGSYATTLGADGTYGGVVAAELTVHFQETKLVYKEEVDRF